MDGGTKPTIGPIYRLVRGNTQWLGVLGLSGKSKLSRSIFLVDLIV